jgi:CDP-paratose 2-epimerase
VDKIIITGSGGLIGSEAVSFYTSQKYHVIGIDNNKRSFFFGKDGSTINSILTHKLKKNYTHYQRDICNHEGMDDIFRKYGKSIRMVIHTAAQPSHDWAADEPMIDFNINAQATVNLLQCTKKYCSNAVFIYLSSSKVYGDTCNTLPLIEKKMRLDLPDDHYFYKGIDETMSVDTSKHSFLGASKLCADIYVQEYGRYFGLKTVCFRCGCLTGRNHAGVPLHGFLSYLMKCAITGEKYYINGYKGKQVRDNIHSSDVISAIDLFFKRPTQGAVYNLGGSRVNSCSIIEAISLCENITGNKMNIKYLNKNRNGDHKWYISNNEKFLCQYPFWYKSYSLNTMLEEMARDWKERVGR